MWKSEKCWELFYYNPVDHPGPSEWALLAKSRFYYTANGGCTDIFKHNWYIFPTTGNEIAESRNSSAWIEIRVLYILHRESRYLMITGDSRNHR